MVGIGKISIAIGRHRRTRATSSGDYPILTSRFGPKAAWSEWLLLAGSCHSGQADVDSFQALKVLANQMMQSNSARLSAG